MPKLQAPFVRNPYNYDTNQASEETGLKCEDPSLAQQQFAEESDINYIADRYGLTGEVPQIEGAMWGQEFVGIFDFQAAQNQVIEAQRQFMQLPAKLRSRFANDPNKLINFLSDDNNRAEAEFLGLVNRKEQHAPGTTEATAGNAQKGAGDSGTPKTESASATTEKP